MKLHFSFGNAKLSNKIAIFNLPAGHSCPFAKDCFAKFNLKTKKIIDGKNILFRCYAVSESAIFSSTREIQFQNFNLLKGKTRQEIVSIILNSLPKSFIIRIHSSGDFFNQDYFDAWLEVAKLNKHILFYAYTKSIPFWIKRLKNIPNNFILTASYGGKYDNLIKKYGLKHSKVFNTIEDARREKYNIDIDDSLARNKLIKKVGLLLHGNGPAGSFQAKLHKKNSVEKIRNKLHL